MNERMNEGMNERMNERMNGCFNVEKQLSQSRCENYLGGNKNIFVLIVFDKNKCRLKFYIIMYSYNILEKL